MADCASMSGLGLLALESSACWGAPFSGGVRCPADFVPGKLHFKNKFCDHCRNAITVPLTHVRALPLPLPLSMPLPLPPSLPILVSPQVPQPVSFALAIAVTILTGQVGRRRQQSLLARARARLHVTVERSWRCLSLGLDEF